MIWLDAHLSPRIAHWITETLGIEATPIRSLGLRDAEDREIFSKAKEANAIVLTKDADFADLVRRLGPPPAVILLRSGNTTEQHLKTILEMRIPAALQFIDDGESLVEIR